MKFGTLFLVFAFGVLTGNNFVVLFVQKFVANIFLDYKIKANINGRLTATPKQLIAVKGL